jgi:tetratricopeptide (TPR) repeat protein
VTGPLPDRSAARKSLAAFALVFLVPVLVFANTLSNDFTWDDRYVLLENPYVRELSHVPSYFASSKPQASYDMKAYRPLRQTMFALEYQLWGLDPAGYHGTNVLLHGLVCVALLWLLRVLGIGLAFALPAALIYSVHPVHTDVVAGITGRVDVLMCLFYLLGVGLFVRYRQTDHTARYFLLIAAAYAMALLSKEMAVSFPLVIVLIDLALGGWRMPYARRTVPLHASLFALTLLYLVVRTWAIGDIGSRASYYGDSFLVTMYSESKVIITYLRKFFLPWSLSARYDNDLISSPFNPYVIAMAAIVGAVLWRTSRTARRGNASLVLLGLWWFALAILPVSNIIPIRAAMMGDRYMYLAYVGLFISTSAGAEKWLSHHASRYRAAAAVAAIIMIAFLPVTIARNTVWKDNLTLFEDAREKAPDSLVVHWNLFEEYKRRGQEEKALEEYREMRRINLKMATQYLDIARAYRKEGRTEDARRMAEKALKTKDDFEDARKFLRSLETE